MFEAIGLVAAAIEIKNSVKDALTPPAPANLVFNNALYQRDLNDKSLSMMDIVHRREKGYYYTVKPEQKASVQPVKPEEKKSKNIPYYEPAVDSIRDFERYERDKKLYSESHVEMLRNMGVYLYVK